MRALNIVIVLISFTLGTFVGAWYQISQHTFRSEKIVANEIALLEKHKHTPSCKDILEADLDWGVIPTNDGVIVWRHHVDQGSLQKVIVDKTMTVAYEELVFSCYK